MPFEDRLMFRSVSYAVWLAMFTDLSLKAVVKDLSEWLISAEIDQSVKEDSLQSIADEIYQQRDKDRTSFHPQELHQAMLDGCEKLCDAQFLEDCLKFASTESSDDNTSIPELSLIHI